mgnify:CR=1 FL=1
MNELHLHVDGSLRKETLKEWCPDLHVHSFGFRKGMNLSQYKDNYERIFRKNPDSSEYDSEFEAARNKSKTFSMEQD